MPMIITRVDWRGQQQKETQIARSLPSLNPATALGQAHACACAVCVLVWCMVVVVVVFLVFEVKGVIKMLANSKALL